MDIKEIMHELRAIRGDIKELRTEITHYKGFVGGVLWVIGGLVAVGSIAFNWLKSHIS